MMSILALAESDLSFQFLEMSCFSSHAVSRCLQDKQNCRVVSRHKRLSMTENEGKEPLTAKEQKERLKWEAADQRKKAWHALNTKRIENEERIAEMQSAVEARRRARIEVEEKIRQFLIRLQQSGGKGMSEERLAAKLAASPDLQRLEAEIDVLTTHLALLRREGLCRVAPRHDSPAPHRWDVHPLRAGLAGDARRFLDDAGVAQALAEGPAASGGPEVVRMRRAAAGLLREFAKSVAETGRAAVLGGDAGNDRLAEAVFQEMLVILQAAQRHAVTPPPRTDPGASWAAEWRALAAECLGPDGPGRLARGVDAMTRQACGLARLWREGPDGWAAVLLALDPIRSALPPSPSPPSPPSPPPPSPAAP